MLIGPKIKKNLITVSQLTTDNSYTFEFESSGFVIKDKSKRILVRRHKCGQHYALMDKKEVLNSIRSNTATSTIWH